jgi:hypothetical protein
MPSIARNSRPAQARVIVATLTGADTASAAGIVARSTTPIIALCRKLIEAGYDPTTPMHVMRGETLALTVRSIGEGAALEINGDGTGFRARRQPDADPSGQGRLGLTRALAPPGRLFDRQCP